MEKIGKVMEADLQRWFAYPQGGKELEQAFREFREVQEQQISFQFEEDPKTAEETQERKTRWDLMEKLRTEKEKVFLDRYKAMSILLLKEHLAAFEGKYPVDTELPDMMQITSKVVMDNRMKIVGIFGLNGKIGSGFLTKLKEEAGAA